MCAGSGPSLYVCYQPEHLIYARRIEDWVQTNPDRALYDQRSQLDPESPDSSALRRRLRACIRRADVLVCIISLSTCDDPWVDWEIRSARHCDPPKPLVGVLIQEDNTPPAAMVDAGAIFVPFRKEVLQRGIDWAWQMRATQDDFRIRDF